ncbi:MAG: endolytic transglycosylase MltG, partial [Acutalibacteraceae bacterium]
MIVISMIQSSVNKILKLLFQFIYIIHFIFLFVKRNLIKNEFIFKINFKMKNSYSHMKSGSYLLNQTLSNADIIDKLVSGEIYQDGVKITIPEGSTSNEIIALLVKNELGKKNDFEELIENPSAFYDEFDFLDEKDIKTLEG